MNNLNEEANTLLERIRYKCKYYDSRLIEDTIIFQLQVDDYQEEVRFPIRIERERIPVLNFRDGDNFEDMVTIVTKTFLRYGCLYNLLNSIKAFYPKVRVIVADDNPDDYYEPINENDFPMVKQYKMPYNTGWFAGRALVISQVETKYFIWLDDDHQITKYTKLERLLEIIEDINYDVVAGAYGLNPKSWNNAWQANNYFYIDRSQEGFSYDRRPIPNRLRIPGYPNCQIAEVTSQYFIARTSTAGTIRMDPQFRQRAHIEWFLDGIGFMRIAKCQLSPIKHAPEECDGRNENYMIFRGQNSKVIDQTSDVMMTNRRLWHYRNFFNCLKNF